MDIQLNGMSYSYSSTGEGPALLLLHGFTGCKENWLFLINRLAEQYRVIALDLPGHGKTESPTDLARYTMESVCKDIDQLLNRLSIPSIHLLGYSMGGRVALAYAVLYPDKVKTLLLESSSPGLLTHIERVQRTKSDYQLADEILKKGIPSFVEKWENIPLFASQRELPEEKQARIRDQRLQNSAFGLSQSLKGMGTGVQSSYWDKLSSLTMPVLLLCGELDKKFCGIAKNMQMRIPHAIIQQISQVGHAIHVEQPEVFGKIVDEFLHSNG